MVLPADILLQAWRPSAYVIIGTINWLSIFVIGMLFGYIVVRHQQCICILPKFLYLLMKLSVFFFLLFFLYTQKGLGQFCFLFFVAYTLFSGAFVIFFVPETKGKTTTEITEEFNKLNYKSIESNRENIEIATKM